MTDQTLIEHYGAGFTPEELAALEHRREVRELRERVAELEAFRDEVMVLCNRLTNDFVAVTVKAIHDKHFPPKEQGDE
jgi:hypothetical protein